MNVSKAAAKMGSHICCLLLITVLIAIHPPQISAAGLQSTASMFRTQGVPDSAADISPTVYFEVTKPIQVPKSQPCSYVALEHEFAYTYAKPPVLVDYEPPAACASQNPVKIVLEWSAFCKGRQFDRIFGVWVGGVEILRSCTAEPRATGIVWTVRKDVTRYSSLLLSKQTLAVYLGNLVDDTYTGVYHVNVTFHYYPADDHSDVGDALVSSRADLIMPVSRDLPLNDGLWFEVQHSKDVASKELKIPQNVYRAVLEVYISFHENDEFWFGNFPNEYISMNNLTGVPGNGPFREVVVSLDGSVIGAICPFTVIYTGGVNPLLWRPITGIGSFDLPSYDIEITPLLAMLLDGKNHNLKFSVTNALNVWYIDANLHLWLDSKSDKTIGKLLELSISPLSLSLVSNFTGFDGLFITKANRSIVSNGWVKSSMGLVTTKSIQRFDYINTMTLGNEGNMQIVNQAINLNTSVDTKLPSSSIISAKTLKKFTIYYDSDNVDRGNGTYESVANVTLGINEKKSSSSEHGVASSSRVKNVQNGHGSMLVKGNTVVSGVGSTEQEYDYINDGFCYSRKISSSNYTILYDHESSVCSDNHKLGDFFHRRAILGL